ncbi:hypothetical protein GCM10009665_28360 [Kitasatospora nipponensis]|uniref:Ricin B lectin domain-containing protein n=1 Tax=Kitasatospora nipponensis TaxID=258049 RepID=A0ABN1W5F9_9ACTN
MSVPRMRKLLGVLAAAALALTAAGLTTTASAAAPTLPNATHATTPNAAAFVPIVLSGTHTLATGGLDLEVPGSSPSTGTQLDTWAVVAGSANENWQFDQLSDGAYELVNSSSGLCAEVNGGFTNAGAVVDQWTCVVTADGGPPPNEQWLLTALSNGSYLVTSVNSGLVLTTASTANGATLTQQVNTDSPQQQWTIGTINPGLNGNHNLVTGGQNLTYEDGNVYTTSGDDYTQTWTFMPQSDGTYELDVATSCITVTGAGVVGAECLDTTNQRWILTSLSNGSFTVTSALNGQLLTSNREGTEVTTQPNSNSPQQQWTVAPPSMTVPALNGSYEPLVTTGELYLDNGGSSTAGEPLVIATPGRGSQGWGFEQQSDGSWELVNIVSNLCAEVKNGSTAIGALVDQWGCVGSTNERWYLTQLANGLYIVSSARSGLLLTASHAANGSGVAQQANTNSLQQEWMIGV